jgi:hypothetical protein
VWDVDSAAERRPPITAAEAADLPVTAPGEDSGAIQPVEFNAKGDRFLTTSFHRKNGVFCARVWDTATGRALLPPLRHEGPVNSATFSADDRWIVTAADDRSARVWDAQSGEPRARAIPHPDNVKMATFSHDHRQVYTICADGYARIWDAATGEPLAAPVGHPVPVINSPYVVPLLGGKFMHTTWAYNMRWKLADAPLPLDDWQAVAELLSGYRREPAGARPLTRDELRELWTAVRNRMPQAFTTSLAQREDWNRWMTHWCIGIGRSGDGVEFLNELVELQPDIFTHRWNRAYANKLRNDWNAVAKDMKVASRLAPQEMATWADLALAELVRGDMAGYRAACAEMARRLSPADRFENIGDWCAIAAEAPNPPEVCQKLLDLLKRIGPPEENTSEEKRFWYRAALGMLTFRLGCDIEALEHLGTAQKIRNGERIVMLIMAMAHRRLGDPDKARTLCDIARERIDHDERVYLSGRSWDSHANFAVCRMLLKEAEEMKQPDEK